MVDEVDTNEKSGPAWEIWLVDIGREPIDQYNTGDVSKIRIYRACHRSTFSTRYGIEPRMIIVYHRHPSRFRYFRLAWPTAVASPQNSRLFTLVYSRYSSVKTFERLVETVCTSVLQARDFSNDARQETLPSSDTPSWILSQWHV